MVAWRPSTSLSRPHNIPLFKHTLHTTLKFWHPLHHIPRLRLIPWTLTSILMPCLSLQTLLQQLPLLTWTQHISIFPMSYGITSSIRNPHQLVLNLRLALATTTRLALAPKTSKRLSAELPVQHQFQAAPQTWTTYDYHSRSPPFHWKHGESLSEATLTLPKSYKHSNLDGICLLTGIRALEVLPVTCHPLLSRQATSNPIFVLSFPLVPWLVRLTRISYLSRFTTTLLPQYQKQDPIFAARWWTALSVGLESTLGSQKIYTVELIGRFPSQPPT